MACDTQASASHLLAKCGCHAFIDPAAICSGQQEGSQHRVRSLIYDFR